MITTAKCYYMRILQWNVATNAMINQKSSSTKLIRIRLKEKHVYHRTRGNRRIKIAFAVKKKLHDQSEVAGCKHHLCEKSMDISPEFQHHPSHAKFAHLQRKKSTNSNGTTKVHSALNKGTDGIQQAKHKRKHDSAFRQNQ